MDTSAVMLVSTIGMVIVLIGSVYAGLYFSKKSAQKRRQREAMRQERNDGSDV